MEVWNAPPGSNIHTSHRHGVGRSSLGDVSGEAGQRPAVQELGFSVLSTGSVQPAEILGQVFEVSGFGL